MALRAWLRTFADHAYAAAGAFEARVTVRDGRGLEGRASIGLEVRATPPPTGEEPDLVVLDASPTPARPRVDDLMSLALVIRNQGGTTAENATIEVTDLRPSGARAVVATLRLASPLEPDAIRILVTPSFVAWRRGDTTSASRSGRWCPRRSSSGTMSGLFRSTSRRPAATMAYSLSGSILCRSSSRSRP